MEKTVYLGYYEKKTLKWSLFGYVLGLVAMSATTIRMIMAHDPDLPWFLAFFLGAASLGIIYRILIYVKGLPRITVADKSLTLLQSVLSKPVRIPAVEIDQLQFHPSRIQLYLKGRGGKPIALTPSTYEETRRLKELLRTFASANGVAFSETASPTSSAKAPSR
ncbi:MAG TPA: hypothetical protein PK843_03625 [bacterium]|nr:hypothetical protein [bacterium]